MNSFICSIGEAGHGNYAASKSGMYIGHTKISFLAIDVPIQIVILSSNKVSGHVTGQVLMVEGGT